MKFYTSIIAVNLSENILDKARGFAEAVVNTIDYRDSNQFSREKIRDDHFISKLGEEAVRIVFEKYAVVKGPDYRIYHGKEKSWAADLYINSEELAVKTMKRSSAKRFGLSWTFQSNNLRRDSILNRPDSWVCFAEYDDEQSGNNCYVYPPFMIRELQFKEPKLDKLKGHKLVVYAADLKT